jgi:hypothetical protein
MVDIVKGVGLPTPPPPHQARLIFPSWWNARHKVAIATLCVSYSVCLTMPAISVTWNGLCRLNWYRGVTVLLPGWVVWKYMWFVHANLPIGQLIGVRTVDSHWGEWLKSTTDFNPNHNHVNAAPKTIKPPDPRFTSTPPRNPHAKLLYVKCTRLNTNLWNKKSKGVALATKYFEMGNVRQAANIPDV